MFSVMLADDDYPVLELLSKAVDWEGLGLNLIGLHGDGASAWEHAGRQMPDILITDIGMPKMDGLELVANLKRRKSDVRVAILSCHSEFQYAQQALRLNVQDYILKDSLNPAELERVLQRFVRGMEEERANHWRHSRMQHMVDDTKDLRKEQWLRRYIQQPLLSPEQWKNEAREFGLFEGQEVCLPVIGFVDQYREAKQYYLSDQTLRFALSNVLDEALAALPLRAVHFAHNVRESFLLFLYRPTLKVNVYDQAADSLRALQRILRETIKLRMSFIMDQRCADPAELKSGLKRLLGSGVQRFYMAGEEIAGKEAITIAGDDLFAYYEQAGADLREMLRSTSRNAAAEAAGRWIALIRERRYPPETVKDWLLKLLIDQRLKLQAMQFVRQGHRADPLLREIAEIDTLAELERWLIAHLRDMAALTAAGGGTAVHPEVLRACQYVAEHLDKRIGLDEIAEYLYLSPSYFSRLFKKETGLNFIEYVNRTKMEKAKELLECTDQSIARICESMGYDHPSYFIKIFKDYTGATPAEYRR